MLEIVRQDSLEFMVVDKIKFRAWNEDNKYWVSQANLAICGNGWPVWVFGLSSEPYGYKITIERYIGFKDIENKEIFVGDIVQYSTVKGTYSVVIEWSEESQIPVWNYKGLKLHVWDMDKDEMEIIGDIHH